jgi:cytochrome b6-f complex iron-sulfur subunit
MTTNTVLLIAIPVFVVLAGLLLYATARRRDTDAAVGTLSGETKARDRGPVHLSGETEPAPTGRDVERAAALEWRGGAERRPPGEGIEVAKPEQPPVAWVPPDEEVVGVTRRQFFNRSIVTLFGVGTAGFGAAVLGFLWPQEVAGFGAAITVGRLDDIFDRIDEGEGFAYFPEGRMWLTRYPSGAVEAARAVYTEPELAGMEAGVVALFQTCPHLGCRVPECVTSQWFECPCHGSQYNQVGEQKGGPAPRGMDRFPMSVDGDVLTVDTGEIIEGPSLGTDTTGQEAEGPHCIDVAVGH